MSEQPVGDLLSSDKGSGARFNQRQAALDLIPLNILAEFHAQNFKPVDTITNEVLTAMLVQLGDFRFVQLAQAPFGLSLAGWGLLG